jgi:hypothetical protein
VPHFATLNLNEVALMRNIKRVAYVRQEPAASS